MKKFETPEMELLKILYDVICTVSNAGTGNFDDFDDDPEMDLGL